MNNEEKQDWKKHAEDMNQMRNSRRQQFKQVIKEFREMGFEVQQISPFQFRFNECIDIFPSNKRYYDLKTFKWGDIRDKTFDQFLREHFNLKSQ